MTGYRRLPLLAVILRPHWTNTPPSPELLPTTIILATLLLFTFRGAPGKLLALPTFLCTSTVAWGPQAKVLHGKSQVSQSCAA